MRSPLDSQSDLFAAAALPPGLTYTPAFLSPWEELALLESIRGLPLKAAPYKQYTARRRIASYGARYDFLAQRLEHAPTLPAALEPLRDAVARAMGVGADGLAQALVTEYAPGTPLGWHRDTQEFERIAGVSLAAACTMRWRRWPHTKGAPVLDLTVAPRSLYVMQEEARWGWQHAVAPTTALRYSITFRTLRRGRGDPSPPRPSP